MSYPYGGGYPPAGGQYPPAGNAPYPSQPAGYPSATPGYPSQPPGSYPPAPGFPTPGGYPPASGAGYPGSGQYPPSGHSPYPAAGGMPYPQQPGYPPQPGPPGGGMPTASYNSSSAGLPYAPQPHQPVPPPAAGLGFAGAAYATTAFRHPAPVPRGPGMPQPQAVPTGAPPPQQPIPPPTHQAPAQSAPPKQSAPPTQKMAAMSIKAKRGTGTVKDKPNFDGQKEAEILRKAMKGIGTDEKAIITVMSGCSCAQRQQMMIDYKTLYGKDLISNLKGELKGKLEEVVLALMMTHAQFDAHQLRKAMKGLGTDESLLIEILCSRTNSEIVDIKEAYKKEFQRNLEKDVVSETSGHFRRLLVSMLQAARDETNNVDWNKAKSDAKALYDAGEKKLGTDESTFNSILATRNYAQLRAVFDEYGKLGKYSMEQSIKREMSGDLEKGMLTIVDCVRNAGKYFATKLYKSMKGIGTDDDTLIRVIVSRCEVDMVEIKQEFKAQYNQTLEKFIEGDTSGDYRKILLALVT